MEITFGATNDLCRKRPFNKKSNKKSVETMPGPSTNICTLVPNPLKQTNKMTRQEIIEILKDAKENGKRIRMSYMAYNHTTCAYILHNSGIHKNQKGGESYITWNYNYELVNVVRKEVDHFGNCKTENYAIRLNNIKELQVINN